MGGWSVTLAPNGVHEVQLIYIYIYRYPHKLLVANLVTSSKALVTRSDALVTSSFLLVTSNN